MDFATRDRYRHVVERIAKRSPLSESEVAHLALQRARESAEPAGPERRSGEERAAAVHYSTAASLQRLGGRFPLALYLGSSLLATVLFAGVALAAVQAAGTK